MKRDIEVLRGWWLSLKIRNLREATLVGYADRIEYLIRHARQLNKGLTELHRGEIEKWVVENMDRLSPYSVNGILAVWRLFYAYASTESYIDANPMEHIKPLKTDEHRRDYITPVQYEMVLRHFSGRDFLSHRDRMMTLLLYDTGIRAGELCRIEIEHLDIVSGLLDIPISKSRRYRVVSISTIACQHLHRYISKWTPSRWLFPSYRDKRHPLTPNAIRLIYERVSYHVGFRVWAHGFRAGFATEAARQGMSPALIQRQLGHKHYRTTEVYVRISDKVVKDQHDRYSPVANLGG